MKSSSKKMAAEITSALTEATLVKTSRKKILKKIDDTAKLIANKINKKINSATDKTQKIILKKVQKKVAKVERKATPEIAAQVTA